MRLLLNYSLRADTLYISKRQKLTPNFYIVVNAAAIPSDVDLVSPDGYKLLPQTFKEISDPSDTTGKVFRVYDLPQSVNVPEKIKRELQKRDNWCNNSEFVNKSSPASPLVNDVSV